MVISLNEIFISIDSKVLNRRAPKEGIKKDLRIH